MQPESSTLRIGSREAQRFEVAPKDPDGDRVDVTWYLAGSEVLGGSRDEALPRGILRALLGLLEGVEELSLDGAPIATSPEPVTARSHSSRLRCGTISAST
jgi:hypothetical protein